MSINRATSPNPSPSSESPHDVGVIVGLGVDIVDVSRFAASLERTPTLAERLFTVDEREVARSERLAARFAANEALAKALGAPAGLSWHDAAVSNAESGAPRLELRGTIAEAARQRGATSWHVSLSHDGGMAIAIVILES
jgi:holo-[acyl-carrier protein] synthase